MVRGKQWQPNARNGSNQVARHDTTPDAIFDMTGNQLPVCPSAPSLRTQSDTSMNGPLICRSRPRVIAGASLV
jgi:hypothetical protein